MVTAAQKREQEAKADESARTDSQSDDYVTPTAVEQPPVPQDTTVEGPDGISRIVVAGVQDGWEPAAVHASDEDKERAKKRLAAEEERAEASKEGRIDPVSGQPLSKKDWDKRQKELRADGSVGSDESAGSSGSSGSR